MSENLIWTMMPPSQWLELAVISAYVSYCAIQRLLK